MEYPNLAGGTGRAPSESTPENAQTPTESTPQSTAEATMQAAPQAVQTPDQSAVQGESTPEGPPQNGGTAPGAQIPGSTLLLPAGAPKKASPEPIPSGKDLLFLALFFVLGYLFIDWYMFFSLGNNMVFLYTLLYPAVVLAYLYTHGKRPAPESWLWLGVMLCLGVPHFLFPTLYGGYNGGLLGPDTQLLLLIPTAAYWTLCASGALYGGGKTSGWIVLDAANALLFVPFGNFGRTFYVLASRARLGLRATGLGRRVLYVLLGLVLAIPLLGLVLPSLFAADIRFGDWLGELLYYISPFSSVSLFQLMLSLPVSLFLFGLCYGALHKRRTEVIGRSGVQHFGTAMRFVPNLATATALCVVCGVYLLFILFQGGYLFTAFSGRLPEDFTFAQYAREGFFELCRVCGINVAFLLGANLLSHTPHTSARSLRSLNLVLSALTLLLIATAGSKMGLYIFAYGLTPRRILSSVFLLWLAIVFVLVIVWQFRPIQPVRLAVLTGAVLVALMCALPVTPGIEAYNSAYHHESPPEDVPYCGASRF